ncbi:MAG: FAD:protein FMN transferase [Bacteroidales bacterium]|jgi:thiamine biosynthesis lipoprotein|nr:FAD:protein FMN transferase [Bacteroidales bacterium]
MPYSQYYKKSHMLHGSLLNIMGTVLDILLILDNESLAETVWRDIVAEVERLHCMFNRFDPTSELSVINRQAVLRPVTLNDEWWYVLCDAETYHRRTFGYFDVSLHDYRKVQLDAERHAVFFEEPLITLNFGGYAKGYALKKIQRILLAAGIRQALVNFGNSSVLALGAHPHGEAWNIGVANPFMPEQTLKTYTLCNNSLSTSGNTSTHTQHIINPHTGTYTPERKVVSAVSADCTDSEVLTTALMVADDTAAQKIKKVFPATKYDIFVI